MKEIYTKPVAEIEEFATVDVLTTSTNGAENSNDWD
jgi:hypothetical protein